MLSILKTLKNYFVAVKTALLYENGKLSSGRLMLQFVFLLMSTFWICNFWFVVAVPESMTDVFYALLAYVFGTKGVTIAKTVASKTTKAVTAIPEQKTSNVDSPD